MEVDDKINILLVDDQPVGIVALEAVLRSPDYNLVKAGSGREALRLLLESDFALILLDVQMPILDGFETAEIIKAHERTKNIPIIFITGITNDNLYIHRGYQSGAVDYLLKPFDADILRSKVAIFVELHKRSKTIQRQAELLRKSELSRLERQNLERYRNLADAIPHMVWEAMPDGTLIYLNKSWCDYTGLNLEQSKGVNWQSVIAGEDLGRLLGSWEEATKKGSRYETECRIKRGSDGMQRWHLVWMVPEYDANGRITAWLGTGTDIHDRKQAENDIKTASRMAQEAVRTKSDFLATMSHEIRTPMNSVIGMTGLLLDTHLNEEQKDFVETIRSSGTTLLALVNDILDFSKIESGKMELEIHGFDLANLIHDCERTFQSATHAKGIRFVTEVPRDADLRLMGDSGRLQQILMNLINNAIKFTAKGEVSVKATVDGFDSEKTRIRFEVRDSGIGIPESAMSRMFERFSQADSSTTRRFGGTGLGLSISKKLVEAMGGQIGVMSEEGKGSTFWFVIEFDKTSGVGTTPIPDAGPVLPPSDRRSRILVAEDNSANQKVILRLLEKLGYRADSVGNGKEVLDALREVPYDLILMDWHMPEMDGCEATRIIRTSKTLGYSEIPIIAMTANAMKGDPENCLAAGMNDYISKPIDFALLERKLRRWIPDQPDSEVLDYSTLENMTVLDDPDDDRPSLLDDFLGSFFETAPQRFLKLRASATSGDSKSLYREAHTLKSNCAYLGAFRMQALCIQLEERSQERALPEILPLIDETEREYRKAKEALERAQVKLSKKRKTAAA